MLWTCRYGKDQYATNFELVQVIKKSCLSKNFPIMDLSVLLTSLMGVMAVYLVRGTKGKAQKLSVAAAMMFLGVSIGYAVQFPEDEVVSSANRALASTLRETPTATYAVLLAAVFAWTHLRPDVCSPQSSASVVGEVCGGQRPTTLFTTEPFRSSCAGLSGNGDKGLLETVASAAALCSSRNGGEEQREDTFAPECTWPLQQDPTQRSNTFPAENTGQGLSVVAGDSPASTMLERPRKARSAPARKPKVELCRPAFEPSSEQWENVKLPQVDRDFQRMKIVRHNNTEEIFVEKDGKEDVVRAASSGYKQTTSPKSLIAPKDEMPGKLTAAPLANFVTAQGYDYGSRNSDFIRGNAQYADGEDQATGGYARGKDFAERDEQESNQFLKQMETLSHAGHPQQNRFAVEKDPEEETGYDEQRNMLDMKEFQAGSVQLPVNINAQNYPVQLMDNGFGTSSDGYPAVFCPCKVCQENIRKVHGITHLSFEALRGQDPVSPDHNKPTVSPPAEYWSSNPEFSQQPVDMYARKPEIDPGIRRKPRKKKKRGKVESVANAEGNIPFSVNHRISPEFLEHLTDWRKFLFNASLVAGSAATSVLLKNTLTNSLGMASSKLLAASSYSPAAVGLFFAGAYYGAIAFNLIN